MSIWVNGMYRSKVIYEKTFPKEDLLELYKQAEEEAAAEPDEETEHLTFDEIIKRIYKDMVYVAMPGRKEKAVAFMQKAIEISELYEMDIQIEEHLSHVCVTYSFNCGAGMKYLTDIIGEADNLAFFTHIKGYDIVLCLDFYTHAEYRNGRQVNP